MSNQTNTLDFTILLIGTLISANFSLWVANGFRQDFWLAFNLWFDALVVLGLFYFGWVQNIGRRPAIGGIFTAAGVAWIWFILSTNGENYFNAMFLHLGVSILLYSVALSKWLLASEVIQS
jgi:hypothetical protein